MKHLMTWLIILAGLAPAGAAPAAPGPAAPKTASIPKNLAGLGGPFDLAAERKAEVLYFIQETRFVQFGFDGRRTGIQTYTLKVRCVPAALSGKGGDEYTVREFSIRAGEGEA